MKSGTIYSTGVKWNAVELVISYQLYENHKAPLKLTYE